MLALRPALLIALCSLGLQGQDYVIDLSRLKSTETRHGMVATATEENRMTVLAKGQPPHTETTKSVVRLKADVEELGKDASGRSRLKITILDMEGTVEGRKVDPATLGAVVMAEYKGDQTVFTSPEGKGLPDDAQKLLRLVLSVSEEPGSDDRAFGTKERKKVGDRWPINTVFAASKLRDYGAKVEPQNITGSVQLKEIVKDQGVDCMRIAVEMDLRDVKGVPLPPGLSMTKSVINSTMSGLFPLDLTKDRQQASEGFSMEFLAYGNIPTDNGPIETSFQVRATSTSETIWTAPSQKLPEAILSEKAVPAHP